MYYVNLSLDSSDGKRGSRNFVSMQLFGLDFDDGTPYGEIARKADIYNLPTCFAYHTFSG